MVRLLMLQAEILPYCVYLLINSIGPSLYVHVPDNTAKTCSIILILLCPKQILFKSASE